MRVRHKISLQQVRPYLLTTEAERNKAALTSYWDEENSTRVVELCRSEAES